MSETKTESRVRCEDLLHGIEQYPLATREQILSIALRNLHSTAKRNGAVDWEEIEYYLSSAAKDFRHALPCNSEIRHGGPAASDCNRDAIPPFPATIG